MVLDEISRRGLDPPQKQFPFALGQVTKNAQDNRSKAIAELLSTERSYIQSLQELLVKLFYCDFLTMLVFSARIGTKKYNLKRYHTLYIFKSTRIA